MEKWQGENIYCGVATRNGDGGGRLEDCVALSVLFVDVDFKMVAEDEARARLATFPLPPTVLVRSGRGLHVYYGLREPLAFPQDVDQARMLLRRMALALGGDLSAAEPARILRVPNTVNTKYPAPVVLEWCDPAARYNAGEFVEWLPPDTAAMPNGTHTGFHAPETVGQGDRHLYLYRAARSMKTRNLNAEAVTAALLVENLKRCVPPLPESEVRSQVRSAFAQKDRPGYEPQSTAETRDTSGDTSTAETWEAPLPLPSAEYGPPFPSGVFPAWLEAYTRAVAEWFQVPRDLPAMLALGMLAAGAARRLEVEVRPGWVEALNTYIAAVLAVGEGETPCFEEMAAPVLVWEAETLAAMLPEIQERRVRRDMIEDRLKVARQKAAKATASTRPNLEAEVIRLAKELAECGVPPEPRVLADDITVERLVSLLAQHGRIAVVSDEGGFFGIIGGRYSNGSGPLNLDAVLKAHSGTQIRLDRIGREPEHIVRPALTFALAVQPGVLEQLRQIGEFRSRGLLGRFLYSVPRSLVGTRKTQARTPIPDKLRAAYVARVRTVLNLAAPTEALGRQPTIPRLRLTPGAERVLDDFLGRVEARLRPREDLVQIADWSNKLGGETARIAGLLHLAALPDDGFGGSVGRHLASPIPEATMTAAVRIAEYLTDHAKVAFRCMGLDPVFTGAARLLSWLREKQKATVTKRDLHHAFQHVYPRVSDLQPVLGLLVERGFLRLLDSSKRPGRPSDAYEVHPDVFGTLGSA